jgi:hypothetical protein
MDSGESAGAAHGSRNAKFSSSVPLAARKLGTLPPCAHKGFPNEEAAGKGLRRQTQVCVTGSQ